jgi:hypothetical protein
MNPAQKLLTSDTEYHPIVGPEGVPSGLPEVPDPNSVELGFEFCPLPEPEGGYCVYGSPIGLTVGGCVKEICPGVPMEARTMEEVRRELPMRIYLARIAWRMREEAPNGYVARHSKGRHKMPISSEVRLLGRRALETVATIGQSTVALVREYFGANAVAKTS